METITTVGLDLAKSVFQVHAVAGDGAVLVRRTLRRSQVLTFFSRLAPCLVGLEACGSAHHWAREIAALGHRVRMMPPAYVKPLRLAQQDRRRRCRSDLRSGFPADYAVRADQVS
jgi:transposase